MYATAEYTPTCSSSGFHEAIIVRVSTTDLRMADNEHYVNIENWSEHAKIPGFWKQETCLTACGASKYEPLQGTAGLKYNHPHSAPAVRCIRERHPWAGHVPEGEVSA